MQTRAAVLFEVNQGLRLLNLSGRPLRDGQVHVAVAYSGVCHSQLHEIRGRRGPDRFLPHALGHEGSGIVLAAGPGVTKAKQGDRVVLSWIKGSGHEVPSNVYDSPEGPINAGAISTFMNETIVSENRVTVIPENMPLREAALLGCAIPTGAGAVMNTARLPAGSSIAVFGLGGIGMSAVLAAAMQGATPIIGIDISRPKLDQARHIGATHLIDASAEAPLDTIMNITGGRGVDVAIEAAGVPETMETAFRSIRDAGGLCIIAGNLASGQRISIDPFDLIRGRRIVGTWGGETKPDGDIPHYANLYLSGRFKLESLITHEYPLENINQAFEDLEKGNVGRALIRFNGGHD